MSEGKRPIRPSQRATLHKKKQKDFPSWIPMKQTEPKSPSITIKGVGDATLMDDMMADNTNPIQTLPSVNGPTRPQSYVKASLLPRTKTGTNPTKLLAPVRPSVTSARSLIPDTPLEHVRPSMHGKTSAGPTKPFTHVRPPLPTTVAPRPSPPVVAQPSPTAKIRPFSPSTSASPSTSPSCSPSTSSSTSPLPFAAASPSPPSESTASLAPVRPSQSRNQRLYVSVFNNTLQPSSRVKRIIGECFKFQTDLKGYKFTVVTPETARFYWREFVKRCHWDEAIDGLVKSIYRRIVKESYKNFVYRVKSKGKRPLYMSEDVYNSWAAHWETEEAKRKSLQAQISRRGSSIDGPMSVHTGGSISMVEIASRLASKMGRPLEPHELFLYTLTRDNDGVTFVDDRSRAINDRVLEMKERMSQTADKILDERTLFYESVGGFNKKARISGLGNGSAFYTYQTQSSFGSYQDGSGDPGISQIPHMEDQMRRMEEALHGVIASKEAESARYDKRCETNESNIQDIIAEM